MGLVGGDETKSYNEAQGKVEWEIAIAEEIEALQKNGTWKLVLTPKEADLVTCN